PADPADAISFALLAAHGGRVASFSTTRRLMALAQQNFPLSHETGDDDGMIKLRKPVDAPAPETTVEQPDEHGADIRLPELQRERAEVTRRLAEIFKVVGLEVDYSWRPDAEADEVQTLLTGRAAPAAAERNMPPAARHAQLLRRLNSLDKAIEQAHRIAARV